MEYTDEEKEFLDYINRNPNKNIFGVYKDKEGGYSIIEDSLLIMTSEAGAVDHYKKFVNQMEELKRETPKSKYGN